MFQRAKVTFLFFKQCFFPLNFVPSRRLRLSPCVVSGPAGWRDGNPVMQTDWHASVNPLASAMETIDFCHGTHRLPPCGLWAFSLRASGVPPPGQSSSRGVTCIAAVRHICRVYAKCAFAASRLKLLPRAGGFLVFNSYFCGLGVRIASRPRRGGLRALEAKDEADNAKCWQINGCKQWGRRILL